MIKEVVTAHAERQPLAFCPARQSPCALPPLRCCVKQDQFLTGREVSRRRRLIYSHVLTAGFTHAWDKMRQVAHGPPQSHIGRFSKPAGPLSQVKGQIGGKIQSTASKTPSKRPVCVMQRLVKDYD